MKISEITTESLKLPSRQELQAIQQLFKTPITVEIANSAIIPHFSTPLLVVLVKSLEKDKKDDIRQDLIQYFEAEYPTFLQGIRDYKLLRNGEGELSPLGHKDEH